MNCVSGYLNRCADGFKRFAKTQRLQKLKRALKGVSPDFFRKEKGGYRQKRDFLILKLRKKSYLITKLQNIYGAALAVVLSLE